MRGRSFDYAEAKSLYDGGMPLCDVARVFGVAPSTARLAIDPTYREKQIARAKDYADSKRGVDRKPIHRLIRELDPTAAFDDATMVVAAAFLHGIDLLRISQKTGICYAVVERYADRLRANGIWRGSTICIGVDLDDDVGLAIEFWLHVLVANGDIKAVGGRSV